MKTAFISPEEYDPKIHGGIGENLGSLLGTTGGGLAAGRGMHHAMRGGPGRLLLPATALSFAAGSHAGKHLGRLAGQGVEALAGLEGRDIEKEDVGLGVGALGGGLIGARLGHEGIRSGVDATKLLKGKTPFGGRLLNYNVRGGLKGLLAGGVLGTALGGYLGQGAGALADMATKESGLKQGSAKLAFFTGGEIPPELLHRALGLATLGAGAGIAGGVVEGKPVSDLASDLASGALGGGAGGATLGAGLALLGKSMPAGNMLARNPLGLFLTLAGAGAGLGAFLKGSNTRNMSRDPLAEYKIGAEKTAATVMELLPLLAGAGTIGATGVSKSHGMGTGESIGTGLGAGVLGTALGVGGGIIGRGLPRHAQVIGATLLGLSGVGGGAYLGGKGGRALAHAMGAENKLGEEKVAVNLLPAAVLAASVSAAPAAGALKSVGGGTGESIGGGLGAGAGALGLGAAGAGLGAGISKLFGGRTGNKKTDAIKDLLVYSSGLAGAGGGAYLGGKGGRAVAHAMGAENKLGAVKEATQFERPESVPSHAQPITDNDGNLSGWVANRDGSSAPVDDKTRAAHAFIMNQQRMGQEQGRQGMMQHIMAQRQRQMADQQELTRRESLGRGVGAPIGGFLGKQLGGLVSSLAGERSVGGIRGFFGAKERRVDPDMAKDIGGTLGSVGGSQFGAQLARRLQANPRADLYMDQLGL